MPKSTDFTVKEKARLRKMFLKQRRDMESQHVVRRSEQAMGRLKENIDFHAVDRLHCYLAIARHGEIETLPFLQWVWSEFPGIDVYAPYGDSAKTASVLIAHDGQVDPVINSIAQPRDDAVEERLVYDLVVVPCVAADRQGNRLGYGGGWYDRFLALQPATTLKVGLCYEGCMIDQLPVESTDVRLDMICTDSSLLVF